MTTTENPTGTCADVCQHLDELERRGSGSRRQPGEAGTTTRQRKKEDHDRTSPPDQVMTTYVGITEHPPQLCQTSNKLCGELFRKFGNEVSGLSQKFGVTVKIGPLITSDHRSFLVIEADDYENVRKFVTQSGLIQWNSVTTLPVIHFETALAELDTLTPIWHLQNEA